ncbi:MAG: hypothetical protein J6U54_12910 [Clostridiales bacterium]|nr:hypothetical protein [Clostridiales bacterium]
MSRDFLNDEILAQTTLQHHGIMGQKWGVRRYQNADGSLTDAGRKRYMRTDKRLIENQRVKTVQSGYNERRSMKQAKKYLERVRKAEEKGKLTQKKLSKAEMKLSVASQMLLDYMENHEEYKKMVSDAKEKYGDKQIKDINYKSFKIDKDGRRKEYVDGSVIPASTYITDGLISAASMTLMATGVTPIGMVLLPSESKTKARNWYKQQKAYEEAYKRDDDSVIRTKLEGFKTVS